MNFGTLRGKGLNSTATLTLGGYDASKLPSSWISFTMAPNPLRDLVVDLEAISLGGKSLLPQSIPVFIDATVPHLWLPLESCILFEDAFGISYNSTINRYLVDDKLHQQLEAPNASVSFILAQSNRTGEALVNITLPYSSFDLELGPPIFSHSHRYFPLRRAEDETQYTLGRTFLQEA